jgi:hypothetical protein
MNDAYNGNGQGPLQEEDELEHVIETELNPVSMVELQSLQGRVVQGLALWQDSIADEEMEEEATDENRVFVDFDLYLEGQELLEIYAATVYQDMDDEPMAGLSEIANVLGGITGKGAVLSEVTMDDEDGLVLVFTTEAQESLIVAPSGWVMGYWDNLPEDEEDEEEIE